jgi:hypothetical protein
MLASAWQNFGLQCKVLKHTRGLFRGTLRLSLEFWARWYFLTPCLSIDAQNLHI